MLFLSFNNTNIQFGAEKLTQKFYTIAKVLPTIKKIGFVDKRTFAKVVFDENSETFVIYIIALEATEVTKIAIHPLRVAQLTALQQNKALIKGPPKQCNFTDIFFSDLAIELSENTGINKYAIELIKRNQPPYNLIYALNSVNQRP